MSACYTLTYLLEMTAPSADTVSPLVAMVAPLDTVRPPCKADVVVMAMDPAVVPEFTTTFGM
jgi:hypothetical protein